MKKITLFLIMLGSFLTATAQYDFDPIAGPITVISGANTTVNVNDAANTEGVPASASGSYDSYLVTLNWAAGSGIPWSNEARLVVTTADGSTAQAAPTTGGGTGGNTTLTFAGEFSSVYVPATDGLLDLVFDQTYGGSQANYTNIQVTIFESPTCPTPSGMTTTNITSSSTDLAWSTGFTETTWNIEYNSGADFTPGNGEEEDSIVINGTPNHALTGLSSATNYFIYYQADCGPGDASLWVGPITVLTECDTFTPDYMQSFSTIPPSCWAESAGGNPLTGPLNIGSSAWGAAGFLGVGTTGAYRINLFSNNKSDWIISPYFDLTGGPFQVEFDFGIRRWANTSQAGVLGSDDTVKLLMTTDNGATWITLLTYDNTSVVPVNGTKPVVDLTAYSGETVQFGILASEGIVSDSADNYIYVDNFRVRGIPTCPEPIELTSENLSLTSTEVGWTETGTSTSWNIQYGPTGFNLGDGTIVEDVTTNPFILTGLDPDTHYDFYVQAICDPTDMSSYNGAGEFYTGYCESIPSSNDGDGVNHVTIGIEDFPSPGDVTYENHTTPPINVFRGLNTPVEIEFGHSYGHYVYIWIDFDNNLEFEPSELIYQGTSPGGSTPHLMDASFLMPATAPVGEHRMRFVTAWSSQSPPNPCYNGSWAVTLDFTINIQDLTCTLPSASYDLTPDCDNDEFYVEVDVTSLGDATSLEISNNFDTTTIQATATGDYQVGPFPFGTNVKVYLTNEQDNNCVIISPNMLVMACPPVNDECSGAIVAVVNTSNTCNDVNPGTILAATPSGVPNGSCTGNPDDDVWFEFEALSEIQIISILNVTGGTSNIHHALYEGSCGALTELECNTANSSVTPLLTVGNTYYIRVFSGGSQPETSSFDLCIRPAPSNIICDSAENFCSVGGALTSSNIIGIPSTGQVACLYSIPNPAWNIIQIGDPGLIELQISQANENGNGIDVDFVLWGPFASVEQACIDILLEDCPSCPNNTSNPNFYPFGNIVDCSYSAAATENATIQNAQSGEIYMLLVTNYNGNAGFITMEQTNAGGNNNGTIEAEITAEIVSDEVVFVDIDSESTANVCGFDYVTLQTNSPFADTFVWYKDGFVMDGETTSTVVVTESSNYQVQVYDEQCGSEAFSQIVYVNLYNNPAPLAPQNITSCEGSGTGGIEVFDLDAFSASLGLDGFTISYYLTPQDANQAINAISSPYNSVGGETLSIRIEDNAAAADGFLGCRQLSQVALVVNPRPIINQPEDLIVCDDIDGVVDGITDFDLTSLDSEVTTEADMVVSYYTSQADAEAGTGGLTSPYSSEGETIYVRAENTITGCYETTTFNLEVNVVPLAEFDFELEYTICPNATVPIVIGVVPTNFTAADVSTTWSLDGNLISGANGLSLDSVLTEGDYSVTITFNDTGCVNTLTTFVRELESCIIPQGISPGVSPGQNDNFDLTSYNVTKLKIFNRNGTLVYSKNNYTNEWYGQTNDGKELPVGTYFYTMEYDGGAKKRTAWIYINR